MVESIKPDVANGGSSNTNMNDNVRDTSHKANTSQQLSTSFTNNANSSQQLEDALATLSNQSQSLLRTMRLDVVVLGSHNEDMKQTVCQLESQWDMLQRMVAEENERKAMLLEAEEEDGETNKEKGINNKKIESSIDWDGNEKRNRLEKRESISKQNNFDWGISDEEEVEKVDAQGTATNTTSDTAGNVDQETLDQSNDYGNDKPWLLRLFGRKDRDRESINPTSEVNNMSIDDGNIQQEESQLAAQDSVGGLQKFFSGRRNSFQKQNTSVAGETLETYPTQQSESPSNAAGSSSNPGADNNNNSDEEQDEEEDAELIQALQVKLKGCDSAVTTLKQLLQFQTSNLYDLQYQHTNLTSETKFNNKYNSNELKKLADQLHFAKVERRRKARQLEDVKKKKKIITSQEEQLRDEVVSIQTELFRLRTEIKKDEQLMHTVGENGGEHHQQQQRDSRHDRVVIVAGNHSGGSGGDINVRNRNAPQTQWKNTRGILKNSYGGRTHPDAS